MFRRFALLVSLTAVSMLRGSEHLLSPLPNASTPAAMQLDTVGNIYVAGTFVSTNANFYSAFVAKLSADGSQVLYFTALAGSAGNNYANALAVGSDGSVYVGGSTFSSDFPVTAGALQSTFTGASQGFFAKLNPAGALVYSTFLNGPATSVTGVALDGAGDVFLTGLGETGLTDRKSVV